jgi:cytochrome c peroxidase
VSVTNGTDDLVTAKLPALQEYQLSIAAPAPPAGSFDAAAAQRGEQVFTGAGKCSTCHAGALLSDAPTLHDPSEVVSEPEASGVPSYASRSATKKYRSTPLHGIWQHPPYFHNGSAATLEAVVQAYNTRKSLGLSAAQSADLVQYLKSL